MPILGIHIFELLICLLSLESGWENLQPGCLFAASKSSCIASWLVKNLRDLFVKSGIFVEGMFRSNLWDKLPINLVYQIKDVYM